MCKLIVTKMGKQVPHFSRRCSSVCLPGACRLEHPLQDLELWVRGTPWLIQHAYVAYHGTTRKPQGMVEGPPSCAAPALYLWLACVRL